MPHTDPYMHRKVVDFCEQVSLPHIPSPAGGSVIAVTAALAAALAELTLRVSAPKNQPTAEKETGEAGSVAWQSTITELIELRAKLLRFAEEDIDEAETIIRGTALAQTSLKTDTVAAVTERIVVGPTCVRKQVSVPAKIAGLLPKIVRITEAFAADTRRSVLADVRAVAHLTKGAAFAIYEIEWDNIRKEADHRLLDRIAVWRDDATSAADRILQKTQERFYIK